MLPVPSCHTGYAGVSYGPPSRDALMSRADGVLNDLRARVASAGRDSKGRAHVHRSGRAEAGPDLSMYASGR